MAKQLNMNQGINHRWSGSTSSMLSHGKYLCFSWSTRFRFQVKVSDTHQKSHNQLGWISDMIKNLKMAPHTHTALFERALSLWTQSNELESCVCVERWPDRQPITGRHSPSFPYLEGEAKKWNTKMKKTRNIDVTTPRLTRPLYHLRVASLFSPAYF